jgi:hypothetical protein
MSHHTFLEHILLVEMEEKRDIENSFPGQVPCLTPAILATREAEIRRITVQGQPGQIVGDTLS